VCEKKNNAILKKKIRRESHVIILFKLRIVAYILGVKLLKK